MKEIIQFQANDSAIFNTEKECILYEKRIGLSTWYDVNKLFVECGGYVSWGNLHSWIVSHKRKIQMIINDI